MFLWRLLFFTLCHCALLSLQTSKGSSIDESEATQTHVALIRLAIIQQIYYAEPVVATDNKGIKNPAVSIAGH